MKLVRTEEQITLQDAFRDLFTNECSTELVRSFQDDPQMATIERLWTSLARTGFFGLPLPEDLGGEGAEFFDLGLAVMEAGRVLCPTPVYSTVAFGFAVRELASAEQRHVLLPSLARGEFYPRVLAPCTLADDLEWREASGLGTLYTYTVARYPTAPPWRDECPQLLAVVELDEGPRLTTEMIDVAPQELRVGMRVEAVFSRDNDASPVLLRFKPAAATPASSAGQEV